MLGTVSDFPSTFFELAEYAINAYVRLFGIDFPYKKLDCAITGFGFGAMENPGLILVNRSYLPSV